MFRHGDSIDGLEEPRNPDRSPWNRVNDDDPLHPSYASVAAGRPRIPRERPIEEDDFSPTRGTSHLHPHCDRSSPTETSPSAVETAETEYWQKWEKPTSIVSNWPEFTPRTFPPTSASTPAISPIRRPLSSPETLHYNIMEKINQILAKSRKDYSILIYIQIMKDGSVTFSRNNFDFSMDKLNLTLYVKPNEVNFAKKIVTANISFLFLKSKLTQLSMVPPFVPMFGLPTLCTLFLPPLHFPSVHGRMFENLFLHFFSPVENQEPHYDDFLTTVRRQNRPSLDPTSFFPSSRYASLN